MGHSNRLITSYNSNEVCKAICNFPLLMYTLLANGIHHLNSNTLKDTFGAIMCIEQDHAIKSHGKILTTTTIIICKAHRLVMYNETKTIRDCPKYQLLPFKGESSNR